MNVIVCNDPATIGAEVAARILALASSVGLKTLGIATGSSPLPVYRALAVMHRGELAATQFFALDEYLGLPLGDPRGYRATLIRDVIAPLGLSEAALHTPDGTGGAWAAEGYEKAIADLGGIDMQLLGIGANGHIGFNEPGAAVTTRTRVVELSPQTREDNARFFDTPDQVPREAITQGVGTILQARSVVLIATGHAKASAVAATVDGLLTESVPASALQRHPDVTFYLDPDAASELSSIVERTSP